MRIILEVVEVIIIYILIEEEYMTEYINNVYYKIIQSKNITILENNVCTIYERYVS